MKTRVKDDLLRGVRAIADELGLAERVVYYQLEKGTLPGAKFAGGWVASKSTLRAFFAQLTAPRRIPNDEKAASV